MNYTRHYERLIDRAKSRQLDGYRERHHIIPRCMGGSDAASNIAELTPEEHYVAHLLLMKMYPDVTGLVIAAVMMTVESPSQCGHRSRNKLFGWLRRKNSLAMSETMRGKNCGSKNSQFGTCWISDIANRVSKKVSLDELNIYEQAGWQRGRNAWNRLLPKQRKPRQRKKSTTVRKKCEYSDDYRNNCRVRRMKQAPPNTKRYMTHPTMGTVRISNDLCSEYVEKGYIRGKTALALVCERCGKKFVYPKKKRGCSRSCNVSLYKRDNG